MNTRIYTTTFALVVTLFATTLYASTATVHAATNPSSAGQALEIAPPVINLTVNPGQTVRTQIALRDVSTTRLIVRGEVNDFVAGGEDGTPKLLLEPGESSPYSMKTWIRPLNELNLKPKEIQNLPIVISVPRDAAPGGYYAVIRFTASAPEIDSTGVSLSASLGSLVLLRVNGAANEKLSVEEFAATTSNGTKSTLFESTPVKFMQRIKNSGNVHEQPSGQVSVSDMFGNKIAAVNVNLPPRNILPGSIRKFEQSLDESVIGDARLFGKYTATLNLNYGESNQKVSKSITFWVIPYKLIIGSIIAVIAAFFVLRTLIKRYNQSIITRAQGKSKKR